MYFEVLVSLTGFVWLVESFKISCCRGLPGIYSVNMVGRFSLKKFVKLKKFTLIIPGFWSCCNFWISNEKEICSSSLENFLNNVFATY